MSRQRGRVHEESDDLERTRRTERWPRRSALRAVTGVGAGCLLSPSVTSAGTRQETFHQNGETRRVDGERQSGRGRRSADDWTEEAKLVATAERDRGDEFGAAAAVAGSTAVVGAPNNGSGSAYVFERDDEWAERAQLLPDDRGASDAFGVSVAIDGSTVVVGDSGDGNGPVANGDTNSRGSVYVFERGEDGWTQRAKLRPDDGDGGDEFGVAVAVDGATVVVGARTDEDPNGEEAGSAYVFERDEGEWTQQTKLFPNDGDGTGLFGESVAVSGSTTIVGASADEDPNGFGAGAAYVFARAGTDWTQEAKLLPDDGDSGDYFGQSVAIDGSTAVAGAGGNYEPNGARSGSAYVFERADDGSGWTQRAKLAADDGDPADSFGGSVAIGGATVVVGVARDEDPNGPRAGSAYVFEHDEGWTQQAKILPEDGDEQDQFGSAVAVDESTALVGALGDEATNGPRSGSAYTFERAGGGWTQQTKLTANDGDSQDLFGSSVAVDRFTATVGSPGDEDPNGPQSGSAYVFEISGGVWGQNAKLTPEDGTSGDRFGTSVAMEVFGRVRPEGATVVVGAPGSETPDGQRAGTAYVFERDDRWTQRALLAPDDGSSGDEFGASVATDGVTALVGAPRSDGQSDDRTGSAHIFEGSDGEWTRQTTLAPDDGDPGGRFGVSGAVSEAIAVVGAPVEEETTEPRSGAAHVFERVDDGWIRRTTLAPDGEDSGGRFGASVAIDGSTVVVGATSDENSSNEGPGSVHVFERTEGQWRQQTTLTPDEGGSRDRFGASVAIDGSRVVVGAQTDGDTNGERPGSAYVFEHDDGEWTQQAELTASDGDADDEYGASVAIDGPRAVVGARTDEDPNGPRAGSAYVYNGPAEEQSEETTRSPETTADRTPETTRSPMAADERVAETTEGGSGSGIPLPGFGSVVGGLGLGGGLVYLLRRRLRPTRDSTEEE